MEPVDGSFHGCNRLRLTRFSMAEKWEFLGELGWILLERELDKYEIS